MYARDIARSIELIYTGKHTVKAEFERLFGDGHYVHTTFSRNVRAWRESNEEERERVRLLPCTPAGLWVTAREGMSGWQKRATHKRKNTDIGRRM